MNKGICKDIFGGLYHIWVALYFSFFFFLLLSVVSSIFHQYFGFRPEEQHSKDNQSTPFSEHNEIPEVPVAQQVEIEMNTTRDYQDKYQEEDMPVAAASNIRY